MGFGGSVSLEAGSGENVSLGVGFGESVSLGAGFAGCYWRAGLENLQTLYHFYFAIVSCF